jgi:hypothetical protein
MKNFIKNYAFYNIRKNQNLIKVSNFYFSIFVKSQSTPNPHFLKFLPGKELLKDGETYDFSNIKDASVSPLARKIFEVRIAFYKITI